MKTTIMFKATYLKKALWLLIFIEVAICALIFIALKFDLSYRYFLSMLIVFLGLLIVFYVNRNEPEKIDIEGDKIKISFFNKVFFKRKPCIYSRHDLIFKNHNDIIELFKDNQLIGIIRRSSLSEEGWEKVKVYFINESPSSP
jgi:hypothetical protein